MQSHQSSSNTQAQSDSFSAILQCFSLHKGLKDPFLKFGRNTWAGVCNPEMNMWKLDIGSKDDCTFLGELKSVIEQVNENLAQSNRIGMENRKMSGELKQQLNVAVFAHECFFERFKDFLHKRPCVNWFAA